MSYCTMADDEWGDAAIWTGYNDTDECPLHGTKGECPCLDMGLFIPANGSDLLFS